VGGGTSRWEQGKEEGDGGVNITEVNRNICMKVAYIPKIAGHTGEGGKAVPEHQYR
jgi:hypothetical protein